MNTSPSFLSPWRPQLLAVLRIVTAYLFVLHGSAKLLGVPMWRRSITCRSTRCPASLASWSWWAASCC